MVALMPKRPKYDLVGVLETAEILGVHRSTVYEWIKSGRLTVAAKVGGSLGFERSDVLALAESLEAGAA
jgi:excisionase family DNA binding protein